MFFLLFGCVECSCSLWDISIMQISELRGLSCYGKWTLLLRHVWIFVPLTRDLSYHCKYNSGPPVSCISAILILTVQDRCSIQCSTDLAWVPGSGSAGLCYSCVALLGHCCPPGALLLLPLPHTLRLPPCGWFGLPLSPLHLLATQPQRNGLLLCFQSWQVLYCQLASPTSQRLCASPSRGH